MFKKKEDSTTVVIQNPKMKRKKMKPWKIVVIVIAVLLVVNFVVKKATGGPEDLVPAVSVAKVEKGDITASLDTSGTIVSELTRVYASPVDAQVGEVPVEVGQNVHKGDYLLKYDTASLQKSYDIAQLQAKAEEATGNDTIQKSNESAADLAESSQDINTLQAQIDRLKAEISSLKSQESDNTKATNTNSSRQAEVTELKTEIESIDAQISALEQKIESVENSIEESTEEEAPQVSIDEELVQLEELKAEKKEKEAELKKKEKKVKDSADLANSAVNIQSELAKKDEQLSDLQSKLSEAESKNSSAEAGILTSAAKANIDYTRQASKLTLEQSAEDLSVAQAGVTADFDGIVTDVQASPGTMAAEGTALITLASAKDMCVEIPVSKYNLENIKMDQEAVITFQEKEYKGKVNYISKIAQKSESGGAMVTIKVHIDNPDENLIIGIDAKVNILLGTQTDTLLAPITSVNSDMQGDFAYVVENGIVAKKYVTTGMSSQEQIEIKDGLNAGEKVITTVDSSIMEGMAVTESVPEGAETTAGESGAVSTDVNEVSSTER